MISQADGQAIGVLLLFFAGIALIVAVAWGVWIAVSWLAQQIWRFISPAVMYVGKPFIKAWTMYSESQQKEIIAGNLERLCKVKLTAAEIRAKSVKELKNMYSRASLSISLKKNCDIDVDWREHTVEELRQLYVDNNKMSSPQEPTKFGSKPKVATVSTKDIKLCSQGFLIRVGNNRFVLVQGSTDDMKGLAKSLFKTANYLKETTVPGEGQGVG